MRVPGLPAVVVAGLAVNLSLPVRAQTVSQTQTDEYTHIELLAPDTASYTILHEVSATAAGARVYFEPAPKCSGMTRVVATDLMTGDALPTATVTGDAARAAGLLKAATGVAYIKVTLARAIAANGQARLRIERMCKDPASYAVAGGEISFSPPAAIQRGSITLPATVELVGVNVPSQVLSEDDGRIRVAFMNQLGGDTTLRVKARSGVAVGPGAAPRPLTNARSWEAPGQGATERARLTERAHQDRDIVYFLKEPSTHAFSLYHDYTESRPGTDKYINVVRTGSRVSDPSAYILDTGEKLTQQTLKGAAITAAGLDIGEAVTPETEVVVISFPAVKPGQSIRLRISETYTAPQSYRLEGDDLVFERSLGRPRNAVVLPAGWYLTASAIPALISETADKLIRLDFMNGRPGGDDVFMKARRRK